MEYAVKDDIQLVRHLLDCSLEDLASGLDVSHMTLYRWMNGQSAPSDTLAATFYGYAFERGVRLNQIKARLYKEDMQGAKILLFHGSKSGIRGPLRTDASRPNNDFGQGFYCGESLQQAAMFVSAFENSCLYIVALRNNGLEEVRFAVDQDWMLTIALFRGRLAEYASHPRLQQLRQQVEKADLVIAPIADNRMYEIIDSFIEGEITDEQCRHCLSATDLGNQFVLRTDAALGQTTILEKCFLAPAEKAHYLSQREEASRTGLAKAKVARRQYRGQGRYIDEVLV